MQTLPVVWTGAIVVLCVCNYLNAFSEIEELKKEYYLKELKLRQLMEVRSEAVKVVEMVSAEYEELMGNLKEQREEQREMKVSEEVSGEMEKLRKALRESKEYADECDVALSDITNKFTRIKSKWDDFFPSTPTHSPPPEPESWERLRAMHEKHNNPVPDPPPAPSLASLYKKAKSLNNGEMVYDATRFLQQRHALRP
eukprot:TRINITY_DN17860_c0_g1_i1.p1 TRINITY_DN17860_c0_g1~~TRINITY_DN17860_c0_g1_i1.p1  ORF type:complete len:198 (+),score=56.78 TRINITY_DN17860_c0_g1_i1:41-634(+)